MGWLRQRAAIVHAGVLLLSFRHTAAQPCPNLCNGHGQCNNPDGVCDCYKGYTGADCSLMTCPNGAAWADKASADETAHQSAECSNKGLCDRGTGICSCEEQFEGAACERMSCPNDCYSKGRCLSMKYFASQKDPGYGDVYTYENVWDAKKVYGCDCDDGYFGPDCSLRECPTGDDPLTGTSSDPDGKQYNEVQQIMCRANAGTFTLTFKGETTTEISYDASSSDVADALEALSTITNDFYTAVTVDFDGDEACSVNAHKFTVEFLQDYGAQPMIIANTDGLSITVGTSTASMSVTLLTQGSKEDMDCSNRGICDYTTGVCSCSTSFDTSNGEGESGRRGDCGYAESTVTSCPGETECNGHGTCAGTPTYACECSNGYTGADCSLFTCPSGNSWFSLPDGDEDAHLSTSKSECSDMGLCDRTTGECSCMTGFEGSSCSTMSCPGDPACNDHGDCLSMSALAEVADINGVIQDYAYGAVPNDPYTWDYEMIQGCDCNDGYFGYDCSLMECPSGDDPMTKYQYNEVQMITCEMGEDDETSTFTLTFREETTASIVVTSDISVVEEYLEDLDTIEDVKVYFDIGVRDDDASGSVCSTAGSTIYVEFLSPTSDVPIITHSSTGSVEIEITESTAGTKEDIECSGRGLCDYTTGECSCFTGYGASDGQGNSGTLDDCGYVQPISITS